MKNISIKSALSIFIICVLNQTISAQQNIEEMAFGGQSGIFINLGLEIGSKQFPSENIVGFKIERKAAIDNSWNTIATVSAPIDFKEFSNRISKFNLLMVDSIPSNQIPLTKIWDIVRKYGSLDSLKYMGNLLVVRLALGNTYFDSKVDKGEKCSYRISKIDIKGNEIFSFISNDVSFPPEIVSEKIIFSSKETNDKYINISWKIIGGERPTQFDIFRRTNLKGDFTKIQPIKIVSSQKGNLIISSRDTLVQSGSVYQYYLSPIDYYQNRGASSDTVLAAAFNINSITLPYKILTSGDNPFGGIKLSWHLDQPQKIMSIKIFRSTDYDKNYSMIAEVRGLDSLFIDRSAEPMAKYFYYLVMTDVLGEKSLNSAKVFGLYKSPIVPFPPMNLRSEIVTNGVKLVWERPGSFINVYHVYRNLGDDNLLSLISNVKSSDSIVIFNDTSSVLRGNRNYLYAVKTETTSGIESNFSDTLRIKPSKKTLLKAPLQLKAYSDKSKVFLYWDNLFKDDPTINGYYVFRGSSNEKSKQSEFKALKDSLISAKQNNFIDTTVVPGNNYDYAIQTVDIYGNKSPFSSTINVQIKKSEPASPAGIIAVNTPTGILISWTAPIQLDIKEFKIYRYERGQTPKLLDDVNAKQTLEYLDKQAQQGILYFYYLTSMDKNNIESKPSSEVGIRK